MKAVILKVLPNSRFHLGKATFDRNTALSDTDCHPHSDTLFSTLVNNLAQVRDKETVEGFIRAFHENKIKISSGFYCLESKTINEMDKEKSQSKYIFLLPRPVTAQNLIDIHQYDTIKKIKKIRFVCPDTICKPPQEWNSDDNIAIDTETLKDLKIDNINDISLFKKEISTHVGIHQADEEAVGPFNISYIQIADISRRNLYIHFYFLYECDSLHRNDFDLAVNLIRYNGIGGKRSSGFGAVNEIEYIDIEQKNLIGNPTDKGTYMTLGKTLPNSQEELNSLCYYTYSDRGGRNTEHGIIDTVRMIDEGAVTNENTLEGRIADLYPGNAPYLRYGKCWQIPIPRFYNLT